MHHGDCDAAVADLKFQSNKCYASPDCNHLIGRRMSWYSIRGSVVAFACNWNAWVVPVGREKDISDVLGVITDRCGRYVPGTYVHLEGGTPFTGYMNYSPGLDFCERATASSQHRC